MTNALTPAAPQPTPPTSPTALGKVGGMPGNLFVKYPRATKAIAKLQAFERGAIGAPKQGGLMIMGPTGSGKTQIAKAAFPATRRTRYRVGDHNVQEVVLVRAPESGTPKGLLEQILLELGLPARGTQHEMTATVKSVLGKLGTSLLIVDEMQQFATRDYHVADLIKGMIDTFPCRIVLIGLSDMREFARCNQQLAHRLVRPIMVPALDWDDRDEQLAFRAILRQFQLDAGGRLTDPDITVDAYPECLHRASRGLPGELAAILADAIEIADEHDSVSVTRQNLIEAVTEFLQSFPGHANPFTAPRILNTPAAAPLFAGTNAGSVRNRKRP